MLDEKAFVEEALRQRRWKEENQKVTCFQHSYKLEMVSLVYKMDSKLGTNAIQDSGLFTVFGTYCVSFQIIFYPKLCRNEHKIIFLLKI